MRPPARPTRCPSASLGAGRSRRPSGCYSRASRGGSRALRKVAVARKAKNNPRAGSRAPNPHSGREACARRSLLEGCVHAQSRVSLTPRYACPPGGLPGRSPRRHGGSLQGRSEGGACEEWLGPDPSDFWPVSGSPAPSRLLGLSFRKKKLLR